MRIVDFEMIRKRTNSVDEYIEGLPQPAKDIFLKRKKAYHSNRNVLLKLKRHADAATIIVFSADWCKDCASNVPVLSLIAEKTGVEVRVFGSLARSSNPGETWRVPPSPPESKTFNVKKIPYIAIFDKEGKQLGEIIENPRMGNTLEEEILHIIVQSTDGK